MKSGNGSGQDYEEEQVDRPMKRSNSLHNWGNEKTMNLNPLILTNIQSSQYFKVNLYQLKTYHEVVDEIYFNVNHLEPWEKGSRKTSGQTGMCGGVRGVGAGGIVSTAFCALYKLYTLKLTRKQVLGLINHPDSPYIRGLGFMYIRFTQPPADLWDWFEGYLEDEEEIDVRAGGGQTTTMGTVVRHMLTKLDWHSTLFPRIPVPIQKDIEKRLNDRAPARPAPSSNGNFVGNRENEFNRNNDHNGDYRKNKAPDRFEREDRDRGRESSDRREKYSRDRGRDNDNIRNPNRLRKRDTSRDRSRNRDTSRDRSRNRDTSRDRSKDRSRDHSKERDRQRSKRDRSRDRHRHHKHSGRHHNDFASELEKEKERIKRERRRSRSTSRSRDRDRRRRDY